MELRDYIKIIGKNAVLFYSIIVVCIISAIIFTKMTPLTYTASTTFTINKASASKQNSVNYYLFDNYYNVQSAGLFSQIVATWFESPSFVKEIYNKAGIEMPNISLKKLSKTFKAVRLEPATIDVSISGVEKEKLEKLINAAGEIAQEQTDRLGKSSESFYEMAKFESIVTENEPNLALNILISLFGGILISMMVVFSTEYFKSGNK